MDGPGGAVLGGGLGSKFISCGSKYITRKAAHGITALDSKRLQRINKTQVRVTFICREIKSRRF